MSALQALSLLVLLVPGLGVHGAEWRGNVDIEYRYFTADPEDGRQPGENWAVSGEPEVSIGWNDDNDVFTFQPFFRFDEHDDERSHFDVRELLYTHVGDDWEMRAGIGKVFWGVTESSHLVDIINQTDLVENSDGEDKLGQPMLNLTAIRDWGNLDLFILPGFRERTFPGVEGRPRTNPRVDADRAAFESHHEESHVDAAIRWSHTIGNYDIGLSQFHGTSRDPRFTQVTADGETVLAPVYDIIDQTGIDVQATIDSWLFKAEAIRRRGERTVAGTRADNWWAATVGFEYTFFGAFESAADVGVLVEYLHDSRGHSIPFENDVLVGTRIAFNDTQSTEVLLGSILDANGDSTTFNLEASRRIGNNLRFYVEGRSITGTDPSDPLHRARNDDYLQLTLGYFF